MEVINVGYGEALALGVSQGEYVKAGYAGEYEQLRTELELAKAEIERLEKEAKFNFEQYQDAGRLLHEECEKVEQMAAQLQVARDVIRDLKMLFSPLARDCTMANAIDNADDALATLSDPSAILAERDTRVWEKAADFLDGYHYLSANFAAAQEDMRKEAARIREGVK